MTPAMTPTWTADELREFDEITLAESSRSQLTRVNGRLALWRFIEKHGKEKCDAMFAELQERDARKTKKKAARK